MLSGRFAAVILVIYGILIAFYIHSIYSGSTTSPWDSSYADSVSYCHDKGEIMKLPNKEKLSKFSPLFPQLDLKTTNFHYFNEFKCKMVEILSNENKVIRWSRVRILNDF